MAVAGLFALALPAQGAQPAGGPVYLTCRPEGDSISCTKNAVIAQIAGQDLVPYFTPPPEFPQQLRNRRLAGWVLVAVTVTEQGRVLDPVVVEADPPELFDAAALEAVAHYRFHPPKAAMQDVTIHLSFSRESAL